MALGLGIAGAVFVNGAVNHLIPVLPTLTHSQILQVVSGTSNDFLQHLICRCSRPSSRRHCRIVEKDVGTRIAMIM